MSGSIIVLEGMDGVGKTTQFQLLYNAIREKTYKVIKLKFPNYESESSLLVRKYLDGTIYNTDSDASAIELSYTIDRYLTLYKTCVKDKRTPMDLYEEGYILLCDRYYTANMLYSIARRNTYNSIEDSRELITRMEYIENDVMKIPKADKILFLNAGEQVSINNISTRNTAGINDVLENLEMIKKLNKAKNRFIEIYDPTVIVCDKDDVLLPIQEIHSKIYNSIKDYVDEC